MVRLMQNKTRAQLVNFRENDYHVKVASNVKEACKLVKVGFQYVTGDYNDGGKIFRKPM